MNSTHNENKRRNFWGEASTVSSVHGSLRPNVSVSGQQKRILSDLRKDPYTIQLHPLRTNFLRPCLRIFSRCSRKYRQKAKVCERFAGEGWVCSVIDGITRYDVFSLFYVIMSNKQESRDN